MRHFLIGAALSLSLVPSATQAQVCAGDCNLDCHVTVNELLVLVTGALDTTTTGECVPGDSNGDATLTIDEIVASVGNALEGCGSGLCADISPASFAVRGGVEQLVVTGAPPKTPLTLYDSQGSKRVTFVTDAWGQASFAYVPTEYGVYETGPDVGVPTTDGATIKRGTYLVRNENVTPPESSTGVRVLGVADVPDVSHYAAQTLNEGFQYLTMRDGVQLSATVRFPDKVLWGQPPYPTVIEYSGYGTSNPNSEDPGSGIARQLGYATVGVNMRGSGCSGGVFDIFNPAQHADGYDMVEIVARQPWVKFNKVGVLGLSYSAIAGLFVASTQPPSLAAIATMSVIEDPWRQQWPGGVYNSGFTREWLEGRDASNSPNGDSWVGRRIREGDTLCEEHQILRNQNPDFQKFGRALEFNVPDNASRRLGNLVKKINVPVYLTGGWQDEQTGSRFATMLDDFEQAPLKRFIVWNGRHPDGYGPNSLSRWWEFLELFVARRAPYLNPLFRSVVNQGLSDAFDVPGLTFEPERFPRGTTYDAALAKYALDPEVRILFEVGAAHPVPNAPVSRFEAAYDSWPPPAQPQTWYLGANGTLNETPPEADNSDRFLHDPAAGPINYSTTDAFAFIRPNIQFDWPSPTTGQALSYLTEPLAENVVVAGNGGYVNLWFASDATQANVEVTLTEVRPDGSETIVQSGVFNLGHRDGIDETRSDTFLVEYDYTAATFAPLVPGEFVEVKVPIQPFAHPFRAGSRVRLIIDTPGRDLPLWNFENPLYDGDVYQHVAHGPERVSYLLLPALENVEVPEGAPGCNAVRGQICRDYVAMENVADSE